MGNLLQVNKTPRLLGKERPVDVLGHFSHTEIGGIE